MADFGYLLGGIGQGGLIGRAIVGLDLDTKKYQTEMKAAEAQTTSSVSKFSSIANAAFLGIGVAAVAGVAVAIKAGSDLNEQINKSREVFGAAAESVIHFSETTATSLGIAQSEALEAAGNFGQLFQAAGFAEQAAGDMSQKMVTLAADMGSFNNIPVAEALEKIRAGLAGEAEPLRVLGVFLSEAAVQTEAYSSGIAQQGEELTDAQKIQARYNIILDQTTKAQGDFARTVGESLPNQLKVMKAELIDVAAGLGTALLPIVLEVVKAFQLVVPLVQFAADNFSSLAIALGTFAAFKFLPALLGAIGAALVRMSAAMGVSLTAQVGLSTVFSTLSSVAGPLVIGLGAVAFAMNESAKASAQVKAEIDRLVKSFQDGKIAAEGFERAVVDAQVGTGVAREVISTGSDAIAEMREEARGAVEDLTRAAMSESLLADRAEFLTRTHEVAGRTIRNFANMTDDAVEEWRESTVAAFNAAIFKMEDLSTESGITERDFIRATEEMKRAARELARNMQEIKRESWIPDDYVKFLSEQGPEWINAFTELNRRQKDRAVENWEASQVAAGRYKGALDKITGGLKSDLEGKTTKHTVEIHYRYVDFDPSKPGMQTSGRRGGQI